MADDAGRSLALAGLPVDDTVERPFPGLGLRVIRPHMTDPARFGISGERKISTMFCMAGIASDLNHMTGCTTLPLHLRALRKKHRTLGLYPWRSCIRLMAEGATLLLTGRCLNIPRAGPHGRKAYSMFAQLMTGECFLMAQTAS